MRYEFKASDGEVVEVEWSLRDRGNPPHLIVVEPEGEWRPFETADQAEAHLKAKAGCKLFQRVYSVPMIAFPHGESGRAHHKKGDGRIPKTTDDRGNPISRTLPRRPVDPSRCKQGPNGTWEHPDGEVTNAKGQVVLSSERAVSRALDRTGMSYEPEAFKPLDKEKPVRTLK